MNEIWKEVKGYEGLYEVSNTGKVRSLYHSGRILKDADNGSGYRYVHLSKDNTRKNFLVHRLVAIAFIPNQNNLPEINHKDENKSNNSVENLEWCDRSYNNTYGTFRERMNITRKKTKSGYKPISQYSKDGVLLNTFESITQAAEYVNTDCSNISHCLGGRSKTSMGYIWRY